MPSPLTAYDLITTAMKLKGIVATGEVLTAEQATDGLRALNDVLETWSIESYAVYGALNETFNAVPGKAIYSIGTGGDWATDRPVSVASLFVTYQGVDFTVDPWSLDQYNQVPVKANGSQIPERFVFVNDAPLARIILYPTPAAAVTVSIAAARLLTQVAAIGSTLSLPPGYARALQYAVAEELGPQYGSPIDLSAAARSTLALVKRANRSSPIAMFDGELTGGSGRSVWGSYIG